MAGYGNYIPVQYADWDGTGIIPQQWAQEVMRLATPSLHFNPLFKTRVELGRGKGDTINVPLFQPIVALGTTALVTGTEIVVRAQPQENVAISIVEYGNGIGFESTLEQVYSNLAVRNELLTSLAENFAVTWNAVQSSIAHAVNHFASIQTSAGSVSFGSGLPTGAGSTEGSLTIAVLGTIRDTMVAEGVPTFADGLYRFLATPLNLRTVRQETTYQNLNYYTSLDGKTIMKPSNSFLIEDFLVLEARGGAKSAISNGTGIACGAAAFVQAFGLPMDIRYEPDYRQDFGRGQAYAWYLIGQTGHGLSRVGTYSWTTYIL